MKQNFEKKLLDFVYSNLKLHNRYCRTDDARSRAHYLTFFRKDLIMNYREDKSTLAQFFIFQHLKSNMHVVLIYQQIHFIFHELFLDLEINLHQKFGVINIVNV